MAQDAAKKAKKLARLTSKQVAIAQKRLLKEKAKEDAHVILQNEAMAMSSEGSADDPMEALKHDVRCLQQANKILASRAAVILQKISALECVETLSSSVKAEEETVRYVIAYIPIV